MHRSHRLAAVMAASTILLVAAGCGGGGSDPAPEPGMMPAPAPDPAPAPEPAPDPEPAPVPVVDECEDSFDGAFEAIQEVVFERRGCTAEVCHGSATAGGLDLRAEAAYRNLVGAGSVGSDFDRVSPTKVNESYLFHKLAAATDPNFLTEPIAGSPMPVGAAPISALELEAVRLWIEGAAPETGSIGDEFGGNRVAELLDACLPDPQPVVIEPLEPPAPGTGVQFAMPPHDIPAASEFEVCFAEYVDLRDQIPDEFLTDDGDRFYANGSESLADPNTHHLTLAFSGFGADMVDAPEYGRWECADGPMAGQDCDPLDAESCGGAKCRTELSDSVVCIGFGPEGGGNGTTPGSRVDASNGRPGFFSEFPAHGIFYWNSHAFNLTPEDLTHHYYMNVDFTEDLRFQAIGFQDASEIGIAAGTLPFTREEYCHDYVLPEGTLLLSLFSHTHKRGEMFTIDLKPTGERLYENPFWDDPVFVNFDPAREFGSPDPEDRTLRYCAVYNNGVAPDGSMDLGGVTRLSRKPARSSCVPVACAEGRVGEPCDGATDHATCDTSPGAGDGLCDACPITGGLTSDDEMFVLLGTTLEVLE